MQRIPSLWPAAYGTGRSPLRRLPARLLVRAAAFIRRLALADHRPFTTL
ncbi:hypothetical protein ACFV4F_41005 [Kitasatospora sp. NPDC059722]